MFISQLNCFWNWIEELGEDAEVWLWVAKMDEIWGMARVEQFGEMEKNGWDGLGMCSDVLVNILDKECWVWGCQAPLQGAARPSVYVGTQQEALNKT